MPSTRITLTPTAATRLLAQRNAVLNAQRQYEAAVTELLYRQEPPIDHVRIDAVSIGEDCVLDVTYTETP